MLKRFELAGKSDNKIMDYKFWQNGNEVKDLVTNNFTTQKLNYIHNNPVNAEIVNESEHYIYSSARNYADLPGLLEVEFLL